MTVKTTDRSQPIRRPNEKIKICRATTCLVASLQPATSLHLLQRHLLRELAQFIDSDQSVETQNTCISDLAGGGGGGCGGGVGEDTRKGLWDPERRAEQVLLAEDVPPGKPMPIMRDQNKQVAPNKHVPG